MIYTIYKSQFTYDFVFILRALIQIVTTGKNMYIFVFVFLNTSLLVNDLHNLNFTVYVRFHVFTL